MTNNHVFDLEERTIVFAEEVVTLLKKIPLTPFNRRIIDQLVGSVGSIGANYCEATEAESKKDFIHKISIAKKEAKETKHWLRLLAKAQPEAIVQLREFWKEADALTKILYRTVQTAKNNLKLPEN